MTLRLDDVSMSEKEYFEKKEKGDRFFEACKAGKFKEAFKWWD